MAPAATAPAARGWLLHPFLVALELRRRSADLVCAAAGGVYIGTRDLNPWQALCVEGIVLTALASLHSVRGPSEDRRAMPVGPGSRC